MKAVIDISAVRHNLSIIKSKTRAKVYAVVKSNAYGHGMELSRFIEPYVDGFCVAIGSEARELLRFSISKPIIIMCGMCSESALLGEENVSYTVSTLSDLSRITTENPKVHFYLKLNTGMNRFGCHVDELEKMCEFIYMHKLCCEGMYTHFFNPTDGNISTKQFELFDRARAIFSERLCGVTHCCAGNVLCMPPKYHCDVVRVGLPIYGYAPVECGLKPAMTVSAQIVQIHNLKKGEYVGYGEHKLEKDSRIAVLRCGYGDGYRRVSDKIRYVSIGGVKCPIFGQVCMDACMVDVSEVSTNVGDEVCILGDAVSGQDLADNYGTIVYEVLTALSERVERIYKQ